MLFRSGQPSSPRMTLQKLGLPPATPMGDPALLLPELFPLFRRPGEEVIYVPHFNARNHLRLGVLAEAGASRMVDIAVTREEFWPRVQTIVDAAFVLTGSLHAAILAQAYGTPWALCLPAGATQDKPVKWQDWFAWLDLEPAICRNHGEGQRWWKASGSKARSRDLQPLLEAFPFAIHGPTAPQLRPR